MKGKGISGRKTIKNIVNNLTMAESSFLASKRQGRIKNHFSIF
jgi:hypothetical protein